MVPVQRADVAEAIPQGKADRFQREAFAIDVILSVPAVIAVLNAFRWFSDWDPSNCTAQAAVWTYNFIIAKGLACQIYRMDRAKVHAPSYLRGAKGQGTVPFCDRNSKHAVRSLRIGSLVDVALVHSVLYRWDGRLGSVVAPAAPEVQISELIEGYHKEAAATSKRHCQCEGCLRKGNIIRPTDMLEGRVGTASVKSKLDLRAQRVILPRDLNHTSVRNRIGSFLKEKDLIVVYIDRVPGDGERDVSDPGNAVWATIYSLWQLQRKLRAVAFSEARVDIDLLNGSHLSVG